MAEININQSAPQVLQKEALNPLEGANLPPLCGYHGREEHGIREDFGPTVEESPHERASRFAAAVSKALASLDSWFVRTGK